MAVTAVGTCDLFILIEDKSDGLVSIGRSNWKSLDAVGLVPFTCLNMEVYFIIYYFVI